MSPRPLVPSSPRPLVPSSVAIGVLLIAGPAFGATYTVDAFDESVAGYDGNCSTDCTLRDAIMMANNNPGSDTIVVPSGSPNIILTIPGAFEDANARGDHDIWDSTAGTTLTIRLNGTRVIDQSGPGHRVFHTLATGAGQHAVRLVIEDGTIEAGAVFDQPGGCIYAEEERLVLDEVLLQSCSTQWTVPGPTGGGAVAAMGGATITGSLFVGNEATDSDGGAIYVEGDLDVVDSVFEDNLVIGATGRGGAVRWTGAGHTLDLTDVAVDRCGSPVNGGGLSLGDGTGLARLTRVNLDENATGGNGANLWTDVNDLAAVELIATRGSAANRGGGWYMIPGTPSVGQSGGPGTPVCDRCAFTQNGAGTEGGGVAIHVRAGTPDGTLIFRNTTIGHNEASTASVGTSPGGGLWLAGGAVGGSGVLPTLTALLQHVTMTKNTDGTPAAKDLHVQNSSLTIALENSIVDGPCEATIPPPGIYVSLGGNVLWWGTSAQNCPVTATDVNPAGAGLTVFTAGGPTLVPSPSPHYDNADAPSSIDFVTCPAAVTVDQLASARPAGAGACDSGAIEQ